MNHPTIPDQIPGVTPPRQLNRKRLWFSLFAPPGLWVLLVACLILTANLDLDLPLNLAVPFLVAVVSSGVIGLILGWTLFIHTIVKRIRGSNLVSLILIYPLAQGMILYCIYFIGCYAIIWS
jgi:hypothetical protein